MIVRKSRAEVEKMRKAGQIVGDVHRMLRDFVRPGVSTQEARQARRVDDPPSRCDANIQGLRGRSRGLPSDALCVDQRGDCHGIPSNRVLEDGDVISIDCGATLEGYVGDSAYTYEVGSVTDEIKELLRHTNESLYRAIAVALPGNRIGDIGYAVESYIEPMGYGIVQEFCGHGVGKRLHEAPQIPNYGLPGTGRRIKSGWCLAIEPMVNLGTHRTRTLDDGWTVITADNSISAHYEHSIAVTEDGPLILTSRGDDPSGPWTSGRTPMF